MSAFAILGLVLLLIALYYGYRFTVSYRPILHMNKDGSTAPLLSRMSSLNKPFRPTPWLIGPNIHTVWGMRFRPKSSFKCRREEFRFADGGTSILDWFEPKDAVDSTPIVVIVHTLAGGTREPCTNNFAAAVMRHGWRAVVANCRACSGAPITSARLFSAIEVDDLQAIVKHVQSVEFHPRSTFMVGFSLGAIQTVFYALKESNIDAYLLVSHIYRSIESSLMLERPLQRRLYLPVIVQKLCHAVAKNKFVSDDLKKAVHAKTLREFDDMFTCKNLGLKDHVEYYNKCDLADKLASVNSPMLVLASDDDPFTRAELQPRKEIEASQNVAMVRYPEGGHVSFCYGINGRRSQIDVVGIDWFNAVDTAKTG